MATTKKTTGSSDTNQNAVGASNYAAGIPSMDDLRKMFDKVKLPGVDVSAIVEAQRKDLEALADANKKAFEGMQALAQRRSEMLKEALQRWQDAAKNASSGAGDALGKGNEQARQEVQKAVENFRELAEMEAQSRRDAWKVLQDRFEQNMANLRDMLQPKI